MSLLALDGCSPERPVTQPTVERAPAVARTDATQAIDDLLELMNDRLALMHDVARAKWNAKKPIADLERERQLLGDLEQRGLAHGLDRRRTRAFVAAQIEAGKLVQAADFARWQNEGREKFKDIRSLDSDLRPTIDRLSTAMLASLSTLDPLLRESRNRAMVRTRAGAILRGEGIDATVRATAIGPLVGEQVCRDKARPSLQECAAGPPGLWFRLVS